jgi:poly(beta-D-mannuronate) lyase
MSCFPVAAPGLDSNRPAGNSTGAQTFKSEKKVSDAEELRAALSSAKPGDTIVMRNGVWRDAKLDLRAAGTASASITLRAETPGKVILTGSSSLTYTAPYVNVEGLLFRDGALTSGSVVTFKSDHGRLVDSAIIDYNPANPLTKYYWVFFEGNDNLVDRCAFKGKTNMQPLIGNAIASSRRNGVVHSLISDMGSSHGRNGMEMFRIWGYGGNEELGNDGAYFTIEGNLFEHADGEEMEIISLKSNRNRVLNNTIRTTLGGITNRSGNFNTIAGNIILCGGRRGAYGMRTTGQHQRIYNNYISGCDFGIMLVSGEFIDRDLTGKYTPIQRDGTPLGRVPRYGWVRESEVVHNTLVDNAGTDIIIGGNYKSGWPESQRMLFPEDNLIANNLIAKTGGGTVVEETVPDTKPPLDSFHFKPNHFVGNMVFGGEVRLSTAEGFTTIDPKLIASPDGMMRPSKSSPVVNAASRTGTLQVTDDVDGEPRDAQPDVGADEISGTPQRLKPLTASDVGPEWMKHRQSEGK